MKQLCLHPKSGKVQVVEVAEPALKPGALLVRNICSAVSPGTERPELIP